MSFAGKKSRNRRREQGAGGRGTRSPAPCVVALFVALLAFAAEAAPPPIPFGGHNIDEDRSLARHLYPDALKEYFDRKTSGVVLRTPTLDRMASGGDCLASDAQGAPTRFTTNEEMMDFIGALPADFLCRQDLATIESKSEDGEIEAVFALPALIFSKPPVSGLAGLRASGKPVVWLQAQTHGDEPAGTDALLAVARDLSENREALLEGISVVIVPRVNVDGAWRNRRGTESAGPDFQDIDVNRDTVALFSPITRAVRSAFAACRPEVFVDFHEMGFATDGSGEFADGRVFTGYRYYDDFDLATLVAHPYNVPEEITELARRLEGEVVRGAASAGLKTARYAYDVTWIERRRTPIGETVFPSQMMEGPPDECIADSAAALSPAVSLLVEARGPKVLINFRTRVFAHYAAASSILRRVAATPGLFRDAVERGGREIADMGRNPSSADDVVLWVKQAEERDVLISVLALNSAKRRAAPQILRLRRMHTNRTLTPVKSVRRPYAYVLSADEMNAPHLAARLSLMGVELNRLSGESEIRVEAYRVKSVAPSDSHRLGYGARSGDYFPVNQTLIYAIDEVETSVKRIAFPKGTYFFYMAQPSANLAALAVEPIANRNLGNYWYTLRQAGKGSLPGFLPFEVGGDFPAYRCMSAGDFSAAVLDD